MVFGRAPATDQRDLRRCLRRVRCEMILAMAIVVGLAVARILESTRSQDHGTAPAMNQTYKFTAARYGGFL